MPPAHLPTPLTAAHTTPLLRPLRTEPRSSLARAVVWPILVTLVLLPCALLLSHLFSLHLRTTARTPNLTVHPSSDRPVTLAVIGDWGRRGHHKQRDVADALASVVHSHTTAVISVGDNFYHDGVVSEYDPHFNISFNHVYHHPSLRALPWYLVLGNHDYHGNVDAQLAYSLHSSRWRMPARYYTRTLAPHLLAIFVDTTPVADPDLMKTRHHLSDHTDIDAQFVWLRTVLATAPPHMRFLIFMHHNTYTLSTRGHRGIPALRHRIDPILAPYAPRIVAVATGHEHSLMHMQPFGAPDASPNGIDYFTSGAGSKASTVTLPPAQHEAQWRECCAVLSINPDPATSRAVWGRGVHGFFMFTITNHSFEVLAYDQSGNELYSYDRRLSPLLA